GDIEVRVVKIDDIIPDKKATFIKMDVEGYELSALKGTKEIIATQHPILAICVYHYPRDIFEITEFIHSMFTNYLFYLRKHAEIDPSFEFVLYAVPPQRKN
ncbi:MAG: FkbM family methyltransferase, partial [Clostridiales bacterium]|nr:FkbM family methyltransferase [Clostridiales bacterium]